MTDAVHVPCGSCRLCCAMIVPLRSDLGDRIEEYEHTTVDGMTVIPKGSDGYCVYSTEAGGCSIHDRAPATCRLFDCRAVYAFSDRAGRRRAIRDGVVPRQIFARGRELVEEERVARRSAPAALRR